jgi:hypothetical protein
MDREALRSGAQSRKLVELPYKGFGVKAFRDPPFMATWQSVIIASVLKTDEPQGSVGSNPTVAVIL